MRTHLSRAPKGGHRAVDLARCQALIDMLEADPAKVPAYLVYLESAILWLKDTTFESEDPDEKARLAATEIRGRLVLEKFRKQNAN